MELQNFIKIYDSCLKPEAVSSLIQWLQKQSFEDGTVDTNILNTEIRNTQVLSLLSPSESQTQIHWGNLLAHLVLEAMKNYLSDIKSNGVVNGITTIDALKYEVGGHYIYHVDNGTHNHRTLSAVLLLNNDYEGGELCFADPINHERYLKVEAAPGRLIVWPSNFLYPHAVTPLTKGKRYSVVAWAH